MSKERSLLRAEIKRITSKSKDRNGEALTLWHRRMRHGNLKISNQVNATKKFDMSLKNGIDENICDTCTIGKQL